MWFIFKTSKSFFGVSVRSTFWLFTVFQVWNFSTAASAQAQQQPKQQHFLVRPKDLVAVESSIADLQCQVGDLAGKVQWSKDGFLLGFDPAIPGYARYSMLVDAARGIYNLRIHNVQMDDEAEYQCQVGPAPNNQPIRARANITVIVPPKILEISGRKNGSAVQMKEGQKISLVCTAWKSIPATKLKWTRNGITLTKDVSPIKEESTGKQRTTSISLTLAPKLDDNGAIYSCVGEHPALSRPMRSNVFLSVLYPPQPPQIEGYHEGDIVQVGDKLTLACISRGGNPPAQLFWYRGEEQMDETYSTTGREATNTYTFTVSPKDNKAVYRCEASNSVTLQPLVSSVRLNVLFAPTKVTITGPKQARRGETITLNCRTGSSNPPVEVSWIVDGRPMMSTQAVTEDNTNGWVTSSNVTVSVSRQDPDMKSFSCYAVSEALGETLVQTASVTIVYPPSRPLITGYKEGTPIKEGDMQKFTCTSVGGNPPATLRWFKNGKEVRGVEKTSSNAATNDLVLRAESSDNGAAYKCTAINLALEEPLSATVSPVVLFPASSVSIKIKPKKPKAGDMVSLTCETGSSNPESTIQWWKDGESISGQHDGVVESTYGGKSTRNRVRVNVTSSDDGSSYTCQATNHALRRTVHDSVVLRVLYKPEFLISFAERFDVMEGDSTAINATAKGNPIQITYSWTRNGLPLLDASESNTRPGGRRYGHRAVFRGPILELRDVTREDGGEYSCEAANTEGVTWTTININVLYSAKITKLTKTVVVGSGDNAEFQCNVIANPVINRMITWRRHGFDMTRTHETVERGQSTLTVVNVSRLDAGTFECVADNGVGEEAVEAAQLIVKFKPIVRLPQSFVDVAGEEGEGARLVCLAEGAPDVSFVWSYNGGIIGDNFSSSKYASQTAKLDDVTWESVLFVKHLQPNDFGYYTCVARNDLGHDHVKVQLRRRGRPDPPYNIRIVNSSYESIVLSWTPGYGSGLPQQYRIRYYMADSDDEVKHADVFPPNSTVFALTGLEASKEYVIHLSSRNALGESDYSREDTRAFTLRRYDGKNPSSSTQDALSGSNGEIPRLLLVIVSVVGSLLLALNVALVVCFIKRRKNRHSQTRGSPKTDTQTTSPDSLMYTPSKYQQSINGEAICNSGVGGGGGEKESCEEEILMKELLETKKLRIEKNIPCYLTTTSYELSLPREKDNCPDILKNRGIDHVGLHAYPGDTELQQLEGSASVIGETQYKRRPAPDETSSLSRVLQADSSQGSCVLGTVGSHLV